MRVEFSVPALHSIDSVAVGVSKDDVAPVITQVALTREGDELVAFATDRFVVTSGRYRSVQFDDWPEGEVVLVDPKALKTAKQMANVIPKRNYEYASVSITCDEAGVVWANVLDSSIQISVPTIKSTFPPVGKLFPREREANGAPLVGLRADFLAKLSKLVPPVVRPERGRAWEFRFFNEPERNGVPGPVYATYSDADDYVLEALIQPAMLRK